MTKRFELIWETDEMCNVFDNDLDVNSTISVEDVVDLLNEQHEQIQAQSIVIQGYQERCDEVFKENEQLKKENYELHKRLGDFEPFERYMEERTSKTSVNDIIGLVKTDEPTNSVELKKELYK